jgi:hypothetical protein
LKPENVHRRRSMNSHPCPKTGRRNCYFVSFARTKLERLLTTGTFNLIVKDPQHFRTGRPLSDSDGSKKPSSSKPFKHTTQFSVLSTREPQSSRGAPATRSMPLRPALGHKHFSAQRHQSV